MHIFQEVLFLKLRTTEKQKNKQLIQLILRRLDVGGWRKEKGTRLTDVMKKKAPKDRLATLVRLSKNSQLFYSGLRSTTFLISLSSWCRWSTGLAVCAGGILNVYMPFCAVAVWPSIRYPTMGFEVQLQLM